jgi:predicted phosphodiesterase
VRYGVISDIHGNLHALEAALRVLSRVGVDEYLCAGDLVGYGPLPNACVARLADVGARCVAGNHDLIAVGRLSDAGCSDLARQTLRWTREHLSPDSQRYLERLPRVLTTADRVVVTHGSLKAPTEYVREPEQRTEQLAHLERLHPTARVLILGHTHRRAAHAAATGHVRQRWDGSVALARGERYLLNPGSVGQSRERTARARFMVLDLERSVATFYAIHYNIGGCRRALREHGLPTYSVHLHRSPLRRCAGSVRRALRRRIR